jgi:hypothetical protein
VVRRVRLNIVSFLILTIQSKFSKKSWLKKIDENVYNYELRREGW